MNSFLIAVCIIVPAVFTGVAECCTNNTIGGSLSCHTYQECINDKWVTRTCAGDTVFDKMTRTCMNVGDGQNRCGYNADCTGFDGYQCDDLNCQTYFVCDSGKYLAHTRQYCGYGTTFDMNLGICNFNSAANCTVALAPPHFLI